MFGGIERTLKALKKGQFSQIVREIKLATIDGEGVVTRSDFYLVDFDKFEIVQFCLTPEKVSVKTDANFRTYNTIERGEIVIPKGEKLDRINWSGILPGAGILMYPGVSKAAWEDPIELIKVLKRWRERGKILRLFITQTPINIDVYLRGFDYEASGGLGDYKYNIELIAYKELKFETVEEADARRQRKEDDEDNAIKEREQKKSKAGQTIETIDDIYSCVKLLTGKGSLGDVDRVLGMVGVSGATAAFSKFTLKLIVH